MEIFEIKAKLKYVDNLDDLKNLLNNYGFEVQEENVSTFEKLKKIIFSDYSANFKIENSAGLQGEVQVDLIGDKIAKIKKFEINKIKLV